MRVFWISLSVTLVAGLQIVSATTVTTLNRISFQNSLAGAGLRQQNFDALSGIIAAENGVTYSSSLGKAMVTSAYLTTTGLNGLGSTSAGFFEPTETLTLGFSSPINSFGLDINTFASRSGDYRAAVNDGSNSVVRSMMDPFPNHQTGQFIGFTDRSPFTKVAISAVEDPGTGGGNCTDSGLCSFTVDSLAFGSDPANPQPPADGPSSAAVPETSTFAMLGLGICCVGLVGRRRRNR